MPDSRRDSSQLEAALRELEIEWPPTPDVAGAIRERLEPRTAPRRRLRSWLLGALAALAAGTAVIEPARSAVFELLGLDSARIVRRAPDPTPRPFGAELDLGRPVTLERARHTTGLNFRIPAALGAPDGVWVNRTPTGIVSLVYGRPRVLVQVLDAGLEGPVIEKSAGPDVRIEAVPGGFFISGARHGVGYVAPDGRPVFEDQRLAGNTLLVERGALLVRVEGRLRRDRALAIADSISGPGP